MRRIAGALALWGLLICSCGREGTVWTRSVTFDGGRWEGDERIVFSPDSAALESGEAQNLVYSIRYGTDASVEAFPMVAEIISPEDPDAKADTLNVRLLPVGERTANKSRLGVFEVYDTIPMTVPAAPGWEASFRLAGECTALNGIYSLTIELTK